MPHEPDDIDAQLEALHEKAGEHNDGDRDATALRLFRELERQAKAGGRLVPYLYALFHQMDLFAQFDPRTAQQKAVELIALLESEERARLVQPNLPEEEYEETVQWMSTCAYDNLADATGHAEGYNSQGMHGCISDGIEVCHRVGRLECISCFREYATDVYEAADDLALALHNARTIASQTGGWSNRGNRRWFGAMREGQLLLLSGQLAAAEEAVRRALLYTQEDEVNAPESARRSIQVELDTVTLLAGKLDPSTKAERDLPRDESPGAHYDWDLRDALAACLRGQHAEAIQTLGEWDRKLAEAKCTSFWFEVRLRLIAAHRLAGDDKKVEPLARQLETKAKAAQDWLTLRRLARLRDTKEPATPLALLAPVHIGPYASVAAPVNVDAEDQTARRQETEALRAQASQTPLAETFAALVEKWEAAVADVEHCDARLAALLPEVLAIAPGSVAHWMDASRFLHFAQYVVGDASRGKSLWRWASALGERFPQHASVLSYLATLGDILRSSGNDSLAKQIKAEELEKLFRASLDLDPDGPGIFGRAGAFFLGQENLGEAERCLARSFRLDRTNGQVANQLAMVYDRTERPKDALWVLDTALREGCEDPGVAWHAAMNAHELEQYEAMLTYLGNFDAKVPDEPWTNYYRAIGLLETGRPQDARVALDKQEQLNSAATLAHVILRACAASALNDPDEFQNQLRLTLAVPLVKVDYLTFKGLASLFERLWKATTILPEGDALRSNLIDRMLAGGLAPDAFFESFRAQNEEVEEVTFFRCVLHQPLNDEWPIFQGCLHGQAEWDSYKALWGVLARDEEEAAQFALNWQSQCYPLDAVLEACEADSGGYKDRVGIVWQGVRWHEEEKSEEAEPADDD